MLQKLGRFEILNPRAYALKAIALCGLGRYQEMPGVLDWDR